MGKVIQSPGLHPSPKVVRVGDDLQLAFRLLTPLRVSFVYEIIIFPLIFIWFFAAMWFAMDCAIMHFLKDQMYFHYLNWSRWGFFMFLLISGVFLAREVFFRYPFIRQIFGRRIRIDISQDALIVRNGFSTERFSRSHRLAFIYMPFDAAVTSPYKNSMMFCIIVDDVRRIEITEGYDKKFLERVVSNSNAALSLALTESSLDVDPTRRRLTQYQNNVAEDAGAVQTLKKWILSLRRP